MVIIGFGWASTRSTIRDLTNEGYNSEQSDRRLNCPFQKVTCSRTFGNGCVAAFRLSGTEPKFKYYFELSDSSLEKAEKLVSRWANT